MDRKTKIMLNALNIKDRSCIDFLKVPKYERLGTTQNEQDLCIQRSQELFGNVTSQTRTPAIKIQYSTISSTEKVYNTRLQKVKKNLFEEEIPISPQEHFRNLQSGGISPTIDVVSTSDEHFDAHGSSSSEHASEENEAYSSGTEYIPDTPSVSSDSGSEPGNSFIQKDDHLCNKQVSAQNLLVSSLRIDLNLKKTVFPRMRADEISLVAKRDPLICAYGARYMKIHREKHFINVTSRKMREIARFLIEIEKMEPNIHCLFDALKPKYFDTTVAATKAVAKYDVEKDKFESPTYAMNMGTNLKQCAEIAIIFALKRKQIALTVSSAEAEADLKTLIKVIESQWQYEISSQAASDININKWNKVTLVPLASDLKLLKEFLITTANSAATALQNDGDGDVSQYVLLLESIFCRVILLNRRRPGELQRLTLDNYQILEKSDSSSNYEEFSEVVSPTEQILLKRFKRIVIRGKRGRGVPVLFSPDIQGHINILIKIRNKFVSEKNPFLFGNAKSNEPKCGYKVLKKFALASGAKNPSAITATRLRKHLATLTQLFDMSENDLEQLASFMGHTIGVHRENYRLPNDVYQTAKISKLLLLMEKV
ncbi:unnamed protein product [Acanthoscelides obtectus]|uniref:Uncharacterized protein n=1 Tax=Acanthoscelides obtectus TaxID=200917 RepID=A0A9P0L9P8_ACAOB|nr:unnamed protein product [Acanthoscelides obtectus]CAK1680865.1 hypothetical protein AOBTE_LOCUS32913 [Acanthoscelides obtectus]